MKIYLAGGYSVMNVKGREKLLRNRYSSWNRLVSFFDYIYTNNKIMRVINKDK